MAPDDSSRDQPERLEASPPAPHPARLALRELQESLEAVQAGIIDAEAYAHAAAASIADLPYLPRRPGPDARLAERLTSDVELRWSLGRLQTYAAAAAAALRRVFEDAMELGTHLDQALAATRRDPGVKEEPRP
ncbi:hypothetical protein [Haliangium sp.]|uniref:hypothetical protein n=1 Tax=Haliangium sp. TaxID=2663208 RepID=UPI003D0CA4A7